jgi:hypothetical protein
MSYGRLHVILIAFEIDDTVQSLVTTATMPSCKFARIISATSFAGALRQRFFRSFFAIGDLSEIRDRRTTSSRRYWFIMANTHCSTPDLHQLFSFNK